MTCEEYFKLRVKIRNELSKITGIPVHKIAKGECSNEERIQLENLLEELKPEF